MRIISKRVETMWKGVKLREYSGRRRKSDVNSSSRNTRGTKMLVADSVGKRYTTTVV